MKYIISFFIGLIITYNITDFVQRGIITQDAAFCIIMSILALSLLYLNYKN